MADMAGGAPAPGVDGLDGDKIDRPSSHGTTTSIRWTSTGHGAMGPWDDQEDQEDRDAAD